MVFLIDDHDGIQPQGYPAYRKWVQENRAAFPAAALDFALAGWHYDFSDPRCPHDAWLETLLIREPSEGDRSQYRSVQIAARLFGAYHNGYIDITYWQVQNYSLVTTSGVAGPRNHRVGHGDWLIDELVLSARGLVLHEVQFSEGGRWSIECENVEYRWTPESPEQVPGNKERF